jgi:hypothetical protein
MEVALNKVAFCFNTLEILFIIVIIVNKIGFQPIRLDACIQTLNKEINKFYIKISWLCQRFLFKSFVIILSWLTIEDGSILSAILIIEKIVCCLRLLNKI